jgi:hypothetical protein
MYRTTIYCYLDKNYNKLCYTEQQTDVTLVRKTASNAKKPDNTDNKFCRLLRSRSHIWQRCLLLQYSIIVTSAVA